MDEKDLMKVVDAWILAIDNPTDSVQHEKNMWALEDVASWAASNRPKTLWQFVIAISAKPLSPKAMSILAAGPLEDLLTKWGEEYIERVETLARSDNRFNYLLGGVWQQGMSQSVWSRILSVRRTVW